MVKMAVECTDPVGCSQASLPIDRYRRQTTTKGLIIAIHADCQSRLKNVKDDMRMTVLECHERGMCVTVRMVTLKAGELD
jgi:hypothetical protein